MKSPNHRHAARGPSASALYWQGLRKSQRAILILWMVWLVGLFSTAILCTLGLLPLSATIWLFLSAIGLGAYQAWYIRSISYLPPRERPGGLREGD